MKRFYMLNAAVLAIAAVILFAPAMPGVCAPAPSPSAGKAAAQPEKAATATPVKPAEKPRQAEKKPAVPRAAEDKKLILIVADGVNLKELNDEGAFPNFHRLAEQGALGLMVSAAPRKLDTVGLYATLGAGGPISGVPEAAQSFNMGIAPMKNGQTVYEAYLSRTTGTAPALEPDTVLNLGFPALAYKNRARRAQPGTLGELLWTNGYTTCVYGNSDYDSEPRRYGALIGMNARGVAQHGDVEWPSIADFKMKAPFAAAPDLEKLKDVFYGQYIRGKSAEKPYSCDFIVLDFGDTGRAEAFRRQADPLAANTRKRQALERLDNFLGHAAGAADLGTMQVMLVSPGPSEDSLRLHEGMTPVLVAGGGMKPGLLTSGGTRIPGLIVNTDIAPHILGFFGIKQPAAMSGAALKSVSAGKSVPALLRLQFMDAMRMRMGRLLQAAILIALAGLALAYLTVLKMPRVPRDWQAALGVALCHCAALFPALVFTSIIFVKSYDILPGYFMQYVMYFAGIVFVMGIPVSMLKRAEWRAGVFIIIYIVLFAADAALSGLLSRSSVLAQSPQITQKFYGVESVAAGLLIGAALAGSGLLLDVLREKAKTLRWVLFAGLAVGAVLVGLPLLGANNGALFAACAAFAVFAVIVVRRRMKWADIFIAVAAGTAVLGILALAGALISQSAHIPFSRTLAFAQSEGGFQALAKTGLWRIASNLRYLRTTGTWSLFFTGLAVCSVAMYYFPNQRIDSLFRRFRNLNNALLASMVGAAAAFLLMYPGASPAAGILFVPVLTIVMLCVNPSGKQPPSGENNHGRHAPQPPKPGEEQRHQKPPAADTTKPRPQPPQQPRQSGQQPQPQPEQKREDGQQPPRGDRDGEFKRRRGPRRRKPGGGGGGQQQGGQQGQQQGQGGQKPPLTDKPPAESKDTPGGSPRPSEHRHWDRDKQQGGGKRRGGSRPYHNKRPPDKGGGGGQGGGAPKGPEGG